MIQKPRGTNDWFGQHIKEFNFLVDHLKTIAKRFGFNQINTPTFENIELFVKNIGESTDVIKKEIYDFYDKSQRRMALRPEGTAGVIRAYVENKMYGNQNNVCKLFYLMNVFRYDRPQNGRYREFNQFGVEYLGTNNYLDTVECISFANEILQSLKIKNYKLKINNLGTFETRKKWVEELKKYFKQFENQLSEDSKERIDINPLRILDDKIDSKKDFVINAPKLEKYLTKEEIQEFNKILEGLKRLGISYELDHTLVRGLDYYTKTVFEFVSCSENLGKSTLIGGGNYSNLIKDIGGPNYEGLGFGLGIERILVTLREENLFPNLDNHQSFLIGNCDEATGLISLKIANKLRGFQKTVYYLKNETKKSKIAKFAKSQEINYIIWIPTTIMLENLESSELIIENVKTEQQTKTTYLKFIQELKKDEKNSM